MNVRIIEELSDILRQEREIYNRLIGLGEDKTRIIVDGKVAELEQMTRTEQTMVTQLANLESGREELIGRIAAEKGERPEDMTVAYLAEHCDGESGKVLSTLREDVINIVNRLKKLNEQNSKLLKSSLDYIQFSLSLATGIGEEDNNYNIGAEKMAKKARNLFDRKI